ncbi:CBS domain-containing protein [Catenovulum sp. SM1970]|uniref:CBS domain-containing protein n=1 Tax=Marinifaba aquimaris TaxID=2741323 RepID=UPI001573689D|nr:CBS domain-containing protein [Marinifaba aquimaris]NTS78182.1 CBS domain-containing protein [Marinifaba aquimaris]
MKITDLMSERLVYVTLDDFLSEVKHIFDRVKFHHLLVLDGDELVGVISDRDLFKALSPNLGTAAETNRDLASLNKRVHQIMHRDLVVVGAQVSINQLISIFNDEGVSCVPVVNELNQPIGIISWRDILKAMEMRHKAKQHGAV